MTDHVLYYTIAALVAVYVMLNVWKFKKPKTELGRMALMMAIQVAVFSLKTWGMKDPKMPFTRTIEELESEIEQLESGEKDVEQKLRLSRQGHSRLG